MVVIPALKYWDVGSSTYVLLTPGATTFPFTFMQTLSAPTVVSSPYQINHNLNTTTPHVQIWDAVTGQMVQTQVRVVNANSVTVSVATNMPNNVNVIVIGSAQAPVPVNPADYANKSYVDARTPNLPAPVTSGTTIQSFTDALGDVWVAKNGVNSGAWKRARDVLYSRVARNAVWTTVAGGWNTVPYDTILKDDYGLFTVGTSYTWTFPVAGLWLLNYGVGLTASAVGQNFGISTAWHGTWDQSVGVQTGAASGLIRLTATDIINAAAQDTSVAWYTTPVANAGGTGASQCQAQVTYLGTG